MTKIKKLIMTLVALITVSTGAWAQGWTNIVVNSDMEGTDVSCFYVNEQGKSGMLLARIIDGIGVDGSRAIKLQSSDNEPNSWDTQFDIRLPYVLPKGTQYKLSFDYKSDKKAVKEGDEDGTFGFQISNEPSQYIWWTLGGWPAPSISISESDVNKWQHYEATYTVPDECDGVTKYEGGDWLMQFRTIYVNLSGNKVATKIIFDNVKVEIPSDVLSTLTPQPVTDPDFMKLYVTHNATNEWDFVMPAGNVELMMEYYPGMLTLNHATNGTIAIEGLGATATQLTVPDAWIGDETNLSAADLEGFKELTVDEAKMWTGAPVEEKPLLIYGFNGDKVKFVYFTEKGAFPGEATYSRDDLYGNPWYYTTGFQMPDGFEADGLDFFVESGRQFTVIATPAEGYRLVSLSDGTNTYDVDADGKATITMPEGDVDLTLTATFSNEYDITFSAANANTIESGKATVKVDDADATVTDGKLQGVKYGQTVTITTKEGYKFKKVEVKKGAAPKIYTIKVNGIEKANDVSTFPYKFKHNPNNIDLEMCNAIVEGGEGKVEASVDQLDCIYELTITGPFEGTATVKAMYYSDVLDSITVTCTANE